MAGGRGAPGRGRDEPSESYPQRQDHELQALEAIYGADFQDLRPDACGRVKEPPEINLVLYPQGLTGEEVYVKVDLRVKCPPTYPDVVPEIELKNAKGLSNESVNLLKSHLEDVAKKHCGEVMIFELAYYVQSFLSEHNKPPPKSFHEEMLARQAQEEQRRQLEAKRREEQEKSLVCQAKIIPRGETPEDIEQLPFYTEALLTLSETVNIGPAPLGGLGSDEQLGKLVYNALETATGSFVLLYEWVLQWQKKMGPFLTSQEKEKIDKCKKQIQGAETEFSSLVKLSHPNVVRYFAMNLKEQADSIVVDILVEHTNGVSLTAHLSHSGPIPVQQLRRYAAQLLSGLDYLHSNSVVHKVLSASNVLLDAEGTVKITDYSISKRLADICKEDVFEQTRVRFSDSALPYKTGKKGDVWRLGLLLLSLSQGQECEEYPVTIPSDLPADFQDFLKNQKRLYWNKVLREEEVRKVLKGLPDSGGQDYMETVIPSNQLPSAAFFSETQRQFSRYFIEFEELQLLGKGAFGAVIKVQNKLDGCCYAVKRIPINPASRHFRRIKGEVTLLSRLHHENIVRYYNAWIERHERPDEGCNGKSSCRESEPPATTEAVHYLYIQADGKQDDTSDHLIKSDPSGHLTGMVGTALYVSPEVQGSTKSAYNQKVDLFSLGIIFFEMSYHPMVTASERIFVLNQLRDKSVISWLLNHDPAKRPTATELLKSELLPPPQMEESELHEVLHHTLANVDGKAYRTMMAQIFSQRVSPAIDYTYDSDILKGSFSIRTAKIQQHVCETIIRIFKRHGAVQLCTPLLLPRNRQIYEHNEAALFMDHSGMLVMLPFDLRVPFARYVARNNILNLKRYCIERVFRPRRLDRFHPKELLECAFDIVTSTTNSSLPTAEIIYTIYEIIQEFPALQTEKLTRREVEAKFCNLSLSSNSLCRLYKFIEQKGELQDLTPTINSLIKQKTGVAQLVKYALKDLEEVVGLLKKLGIKLQVLINLGLVYKVQQHNGIIFQFVAFIRRRQRAIPEILAAGGRYDLLIPQFRGPQALGPVPTAIGASIAIDKITAATLGAEEPVIISSCDLLVVSVGQMSMSRAINLTQKLWSAGITAEIMYDWSQVKSFEKERQTEKRVLESDLVDHVVQKLRTKVSDERTVREASDNLAVQNLKGSFSNASGLFEVHGATVVPIVSVMAPEKLSASTRRRYETQVHGPFPGLSNVQTRLQTSLANLHQKSSEIEILAWDGDEQAFNTTVKQLLSRLPKQRYLKLVCDEIYNIKVEKKQQQNLWGKWWAPYVDPYTVDPCRSQLL
ncbi:eukaryotic translation initiation factor 2-alpha kinase 4 [Camelus ferus]|nr:eukaryotic translation initiation factor 2-alpha kinase 4 [Camelus ferus]